MWTAERKVGLFTVLGLAGFIYATMFLNHVSLFSPPEYTVEGTFQNVVGLKAGSTVRYSGVPVGRVESIKVEPHGVLVSMRIKKDVDIPKDSSFHLNTDGLLGERFIAITPGQENSYLENHAHVEGAPLGDVDTAIHQMTRVMKEAEKLLQSMNQLAGNGAVQDSMRTTLENAAAITQNLAMATSQMNALMANNAGNINTIAVNLAALSENMNHITKQLEDTLTAVEGKGETAQNLKDIITNMKETTESVKVMSQNLETVLGDRKTAQELQETIHNAAHISGVAKAVLTGQSHGSIDSRSYMELLHTTSPNTYDASVAMLVGTDKSVYALGAEHIGNGTRYNVNMGRYILPKVTFRGGLFESKPGVAVDYGLLKGPVTVSASVRDFNDTRYTLKSAIKLSDSTRFVMQMNRPYHSEGGGNYFGMQYTF